MLAAFAQGAAAAPPVQPYVYATNYPLAYFAARICDGSLLVLYPRIEGEASKWRPDRTERGDMRRAELVFVNGAGHEEWDAAAVVPAERLVDTTAGLEAREPADTHGAGAPWQLPPARPRHSVATWLDLSLAIGQAAAVKQALLAAGLGDRVAVQANFDKLEAELSVLDRKLLQAAGDGGPVPLIAARPVYDYLARRYPFSLKSLDWSGHGIPSEAKLLELELMLEEHPARLMLWPEMPDWPLRQRLEAFGMVLLVLPTLERWPPSGDFVSLMQENVERLTHALATLE